jgi:glycosyltransferase involved in cell wall biosynthesis
MKYAPSKDAIKNSGLTFSIVIETENLGMAGIADLEETIASLEAQTYSIKNAKEIFIIVGEHVSSETLNMLRGKYPWLQIHIEKKKLDYTGAKMRGAELATGDIVVFADSDVIYNKDWLMNMLYTFIWSPGASIVSGETRIDVTSIYRMAIQLTWMLNVNTDFFYPKPHRNFYLNNFAIKRIVMLAVPFVSGLPLYRSIIGEWIKQLRLHGYAIMRAPHALGFHAPPGNPWDYWYRMLIFGADEVAKGDFYFLPDGQVVEKFSPLRRLYGLVYFMALKLYRISTRLYFLLKQDLTNVFYIVFSLPIVVATLLFNLAGAIIAFFNREYLFKKISAREEEHVV